MLEYLEGNLVEGDDAAEADRDVPDLQQDLPGLRARLADQWLYGTHGAIPVLRSGRRIRGWALAARQLADILSPCSPVAAGCPVCPCSLACFRSYWPVPSPSSTRLLTPAPAPHPPQ